MASKEVLVKTLRNADGKSFQKYRALEGFFDLDDFTLFFDDIQNDPSGYSRMRVRVPLSRSGFPQDAYSCAPRKTALRDLIARRFWESTRVHAKSPVPGASGGEISVPRPGQEILDRGTAVLTPYYIEVRFRAVLPSAGKTVPFRAAEEMIFGRLASIVRESMFFGAYKQSKVYGHVITAENADSIRSRLGGMGLGSFGACGSILPRREDGLAPLSGAVPFDAPADTVISIDVPNGEPVRGLGIPEGLTIVCGGSGHGKSSFLEAILAGVYDHIPEDGREFVITRPDAVMIRREEGRSASGVDVSRFVRRCRECPDPSSFTAERTSSAMSQAVAASEAIESGSGRLLLEEHTSAPSE
jgi:predicted ABC-class ATPase